MGKYKRPLEDNILLRLLHIHAFAHLFNSLFKPITRSDLYDLRDQYKPHFLISKYDSLKHQLRQRGKGFKRILFEMFKTDILIGIVMSVIVALLIIESPLIMKKILAHIQTPKATVDETNAVRGVIKMWLGVFVIKIFFNEFTERKFFMVGLRLQLLLTNLFMRKITHLSLNSIHSSKPEVMNYLIVEIKKVEIFFKKGSWLFSQPPVLVLGMLMIFLKNFWLGFLTLQMVLGFVAIRILVNNHTDNAHHHKLELQEKRTYMNVQFLSQMKEMKTIGFSDLLSIKTEQHLNQENSHNTKYMALKHAIQANLVFMPFVFFFFVFLLRLTQATSLFNLSAIDAYILLIYVQILVPALKNLRYVLNYLEDMLGALEKLEAFLYLPENIQPYFENTKLPLSCIRFGNISLPEQGKNPTHQHKRANKSDPKSFLLQKLSTRAASHRSSLNHFHIPFDIQLSPGDHMVILCEHNEGSVLLSLIAGSLHLPEGNIEYNGKMTYVSSEIWLVDGTIRDNVLMGRPESQSSLRLIYDIVELQKDFSSRLPQGDDTHVSSPYLTLSHKRRIAIARALYTDADIYLLDHIFHGVDPATTQQIYSKLSRHLSQKTFLLVATDLKLQPKDKVLMFVAKAKSVEFGQFDRLHEEAHPNISSYVRDIREPRSMEESRVIVEERPLRQEEEAAIGRERIVPFSAYKRFFSYGSWQIVALIGVIIVVVELAKLYLDLYLGQAHQSIKPSHQHFSFKHYLRVLLLMLTLQGLFSFLELLLSNRTSRNITKDLARDITARSQAQSIESEQQLQLLEICSGDYEDTFLLVHRFPQLISYLMTLFITICLLLFCSPKLIFPLLCLILFNSIFFLLLTRTQSEISRHRPHFLNTMYRNVFAFIQGIETIKLYADPKEFLFQKLSFVTDYAVYIQNERFAWHAVKMVSEVTTLAITYWTMSFAASKRTGMTQHNLVGLFVALSYCLKLSGLINYVVEEVVEIQAGMRKNVEKVFSLIEHPTPQEQETGSCKPTESTIQWEGEILKQNTTNEVSLRVEAHEKVALKGEKHSISHIISTLTKCAPTTPTTSVQIGGINLSLISQATINQFTYHMARHPFIFTGTIYQNIDPLGRYKFSQIVTSIRYSGLPECLHIPNETKCSQYRITYQNCSLRIRHAIDLARLFLRDPQIVLHESCHKWCVSAPTQKTFKEFVSKCTLVLCNPGGRFRSLYQREIHL